MTEQERTPVLYGFDPNKPITLYRATAWNGDAFVTGPWSERHDDSGEDEQEVEVAPLSRALTAESRVQELEGERTESDDAYGALAGRFERMKERAEAAESHLARLEEVVYTAEEFICTVQKWMGSPEDKDETLDAIRSVLPSSTPPSTGEHDG